MNILVLSPYLYNTAPGQRFRIEQWAGYLEREGVHCHFLSFETPGLKQVLYERRYLVRKLAELSRSIARRVRDVFSIAPTWDLIYVYRELLPIGPPLLERILAKKEIPVIYDFDDAIFLPTVSEANRHFGWLKYPQKTGTICRLSAHVIVGNAYLEEYALKYTPSVSVVCTTIDTDRFLPKGRVDVQGVPIIGWSGSLTTLEGLKTIEPAFKLLRTRWPFRLRVIGGRNVSFRGLEMESKPWSAATELDDLRSFDIGVMPLPDDAWSRGKCGLKALQYMALGIPTVASPIGVNAEIIEDGKNGFLASSQDEWVEKLSSLLTDEALRHRFAVEGRKTVEAWYSMKVQAPRVLKIFEHICRNERVSRLDESLPVTRGDAYVKTEPPADALPAATTNPR